MRPLVVALFALSVGCAEALDEGENNGGDTGSREDPGPVDTSRSDGSGKDVLDDTSAGDTSAGDSSIADSGLADSGLADSVVLDTGVLDTGSTPKDTGVVDTGSATKDTGSGVVDTGSTGPIKGGPCVSGAPGATAFRIRWAGSGSGSTAYPVYEVSGLPDSTGFKAGAYGYSIGYTPVFEDIFLGVGGLRLDSSSFVDIDFSTVGLGSISSATLSIYGRSFNTTSSGSYTWQTFDGTGATPTGAVANSAPYQWYGPAGYLGSGPIGDVLAVIKTGKSIKLRIKAGGPSGSLIVNKIELCLQAS